CARAIAIGVVEELPGGGVVDQPVACVTARRETCAGRKTPVAGREGACGAEGGKGGVVEGELVGARDEIAYQIGIRHSRCRGEDERVLPGATDQRVVPAHPRERVVAFASFERLGGRSALDGIVERGADHMLDVLDETAANPVQAAAVEQA